jgi:hypothetical protein
MLLKMEVHLSSLLLRNNLDERKVRQVNISAFNLAINSLLEDESDFDTKWDKWIIDKKGEIDNIKYEIEIEDIGSKFNINFSNYIFLSQLACWNNNMENMLNESLIYDLFLLKNGSGEAYYDENYDYLNTFGKFNINCDNLNSLGKILDLILIHESIKALIISSLNNLRHDEKYLSSIDDLPLYINGLDLNTLEKLRPFISTQGRFNINFISDELLGIIIKGLKIDSKYKNTIIKYRQNNEIRDLSELKFIMPEADFKILKPCFTTSSTYFLIHIKSFLDNSERNKNIEVVVERVKGDNGREIRIIKWSEY